MAYLNDPSYGDPSLRLTGIDPERLRVIGDGPDPYVVDPRVVIISAICGAVAMYTWHAIRQRMGTVTENRLELTGGQSVAATRDMAEYGGYPPHHPVFSMRADALALENDVTETATRPVRRLDSDWYPAGYRWEKEHGYE